MSCYDCKYYREDETRDYASYCGKTKRWLPIHDISYCCVHYKPYGGENDEKSRRK